MQHKPRISIAPSRTDRIADIAAWLAIAALWVLVIRWYPLLPDRIPVHYNVAGVADRYGDRVHIFILPVVATIITVALSLLGRYPHMLNYPVTITPGNAYRQYAGAARLLRYLKLLIVISFGLIVYRTVDIATGKDTLVSVWFLYLIMALPALPVMVWVVSSLMYRKKRAKDS